MSAFSISGAWEETKGLLDRDGRLFASVALALIVLPTAILGVIDPRVQQGEIAPTWFNLLILVISLISLAGQLALIRLAVGPSITVGGAIGHGFSRLPNYVFVLIILIVGVVALMLPFILIAVVMGMDVEVGSMGFLTGSMLLLLLLFLIAVMVLMTRFSLAMPVASTESAGPLTILNRCWKLTEGHWLKLFGFLVVFSIAALIVLLALSVVLGSLTALLFDSRGPMTLAALVESLINAVVTGIFSVLFTLMLARIYVQLSGRDTVEKASA
jgi:hypothetical protein